MLLKKGLIMLLAKFIKKGDKRRHTMNVDLEACEEDQDTLKGE